jgi:hypothetical protein
VWTYFQDFGTPLSTIHAEVLKVFTMNWTSQGYVVEVLSESDAKKHPDYRKFKRRVSRYPTTNAREYETACFLRWLALNVAKTAQAIYDGKPHVSDMHMFQGLRIGDSIPVCHLAEMNFPLKHFSTNSSGGLEAKLNTMRSAANF